VFWCATYLQRHSWSLQAKISQDCPPQSLENNREGEKRKKKEENKERTHPDQTAEPLDRTANARPRSRPHPPHVERFARRRHPAGPFCRRTRASELVAETLRGPLASGETNAEAGGGALEGRKTDGEGEDEDLEDGDQSGRESVGEVEEPPSCIVEGRTKRGVGGEVIVDGERRHVELRERLKARKEKERSEDKGSGGRERVVGFSTESKRQRGELSTVPQCSSIASGRLWRCAKSV
jgi:hypothetical protein